MYSEDNLRTSDLNNSCQFVYKIFIEILLLTKSEFM